MGLAKETLRFIVREHHSKPIRGPLLELGRQTITADESVFRSILASEGVPPAPTTPMASITKDVAFFNLLGVSQVQALDFSDYEGADIVHDLNYPIDDSLIERFNFILDGGTSEHVFDICQTMENIARMLKPGGRILHMQPMNNYVNHGFYQFCPHFYYDFYSANQFTNLRGFLFEQRGRRPWDCHLYELPAEVPVHRISSGDPHKSMAIFFLAEKTPSSTSDVIPTQSVYASLKDGASLSAVEKTMEFRLSKQINRALPRPKIRLLQRMITALHLEKTGGPLFFDPDRHRGHPYGLKYLGKLN